MQSDTDFKGKTYDLLRLSMVGVLLAILISVFIEWRAAHECLQTSISAYYFTPVRSIFVAGLIAVGVGMIVLEGRNPVEDAFLNLAGLFAPVVAFVPTVDVNSCALQPGGALSQNKDPSGSQVVEVASPAITNNMLTYLVVVGLAFVLMAFWRVLVTRRTGKSTKSGTRPPGRPDAPYLLTSALGLAAWVVGFVYYVNDQRTLVDKGHGVAATSLFVCIIIVVFAGARERAEFRHEQKWKDGSCGTRLRLLFRDKNAYLGLAMVVAAVAITGIGRSAGWSHWVLDVELALLVLFVVFWLAQTFDSWSGLEPASKKSPDQKLRADPEVSPQSNLSAVADPGVTSSAASGSGDE